MSGRTYAWLPSEESLAHARTPPPLRRGWRRPVLASLLAVVVLGAGGIGVGLLLAHHAAQQRDAALLAQVHAEVPALEAFVASTRGLEFRFPVAVHVLHGRAFDAVVSRHTGAADTGRDDTLHGLRELDGGTSLADRQAQFHASVEGLYVSSTEGLYVRAERLDAAARSDLVHELTHALDDQQFHVVSSASGSTADESALVFRSLVEGDAVRVAQAWGRTQPDDVQDDLADAGLLDDWDPQQDVALDTALFPYWAGGRLVQHLADTGGEGAVDAAFTNPPRTTAQVLHPERTDPGRLVAQPAGLPDAPVVDRGVLGELGLAQLLDVNRLGTGPQAGWQGDTYVTLAEPSGPCLYDDLLVDSGTDRDALVTALNLLPGVHADPTGPYALRLRSCAA